MFGRNGCLLVLVFCFAVSFVQGQDHAPARIAPHLLVPPRTQLPPGRIVRPVRPPLAPPGEFGLPQFVRAAGIIFSGTVTKIERHPALPGQTVETVKVTFRVEDGFRGATRGRDLAIRQWIGLWASGQRYRVGERVLLFLYPTSKLGLTSCVGGPLGRFAVDAGGRVLLTAQHQAVFRKDPALGGKSQARLSDLALAVRHASEEE